MLQHINLPPPTHNGSGNSRLTNVRYNYFDAIRGLSMILVVFWHVMYFSIGSEEGINPFFVSFRMPLFFFISGFFAYKPFESWNNTRIKDILIRKFKVQIIGTLIFISLFCIFTYNNLPNRINFNGFSEGYWFTLVLFRFFLVYITIVFACRRMTNRYKLLWSIIISLAIICACINNNFLNSYVNFFNHFHLIFTIIITSQFIYFFPYFVLGLLAKAYLPEFEKILTKDKVKLIIMCLVVTIWTLSFLFSSRNLKPHSFGGRLISYPLGILTVLLIIQFFYSIRHVFDRDSRFSKGIRLIGRRTLDIYFLHYFFLPDLHFLKPYLSSGNPALLQLIIGLPVAMIIVGITLLVGQVIRMSPVLAEWLLGVKNKHHARQNPGIEGNQTY